MAFSPGLFDTHQPRWAERVACGAAGAVVVIDLGLVPRGPHADPEPGHAGIPDRIFAGSGPEPADIGIRQPHLLWHGSALPGEHRRHGLDRVADRRIGEVDVLEGGGRVVVTEELADGKNGLAVQQRDAGVSMSEVMEPDIA